MGKNSLRKASDNRTNALYYRYVTKFRTTPQNAWNTILFDRYLSLEHYNAITNAYDDVVSELMDENNEEVLAA